jgi:hypothetical protein
VSDMSSEWKPIETAPEGKPILVWVPGINSGLDSAEVVIILWSADDPSGRGYSIWTNGGPNGGSDMDFEHSPTHWMPLPKPPEST